MQRISQSPVDPAFVQDPYPFYDRLRARGRLVHWDEYDMPVSADFATVSALLKDSRLGREPPPETAAPVPPHLAPFYAVEHHSMLELEPPRHTRLRGLVLRAFTSRRIAGMENEIAALCQELIDAFPAGPFDLLPAYAQRVPVIVIARLLGVPDAAADDLLAWSNAMVAMYQARRGRAEEDAAAAAATEFRDFLLTHIDRRRVEPGDDLISHLIAAEEDGARLSRDELVATCILLLNAGHEATVHTLGNGVRAILTHGAQEALAPATADATVEEVLRWDAPLHLFTRHVYEPIEIDGHSLGRGDRVGCLLGAANRDPAVFEAPHRFEPERPRHTNVAFGAGRHFCVGAPLARLELRVALATLFSRCPTLSMPSPPRFADLYHFHGLRALTVTC